jgi:hypothetical protein
VSWFYEIRDTKNVVVDRNEGFASKNSALAVARKKARELKASGSLSVGGVRTITIGEDKRPVTPGY